MNKNITRFRVFYAAMYASIAVYELLHSLLLIFGVLFIIGGWWFFHDICRLVGRTSSDSQKMYVMIPGTIFVVLLTGMLSTLTYIVLIGSVGVFLHSSLHSAVDIADSDGQEMKTMVPVEEESLLRAEFGEEDEDSPFSSYA